MEQRPHLARHYRGLPWLVAIAMFMQMLDVTILNTAIPAMATQLGTSPFSLHAVILAYGLAVAVCTPASGWLADRFGNRRVFAGSLLLFTAASLAAGLSQSLGFLVVVRVLQGAGAALMVPVGLATILHHYPRDRYLRVMNYVTIPGLVGPLAGPLLGGWLTEYASWRWIFFINVPVGVLGLMLIRRCMPDYRQVSAHRFDTFGFVLFAGGIALLTTALDALGQNAWPTSVALPLALLALVPLWLCTRHFGRHPAPLFSPALWQQRGYRAGILATLLGRLGTGAVPLLVPLQLQLALGFSPTKAGIYIGVASIGAIGAKPLMPMLIRRCGRARLLTATNVLLALATWAFGWLTPDSAGVLILLLLLLNGALNSTQYTVLNAATVTELTPGLTNMGNTGWITAMQLSMAFGIAVGSLLLAALAPAGHAGTALLPAFHWTFAVLAVLTLVAVWFGRAVRERPADA
ncbi:MFS transporter [Jeongeupia chitinilytica]|uniref:MFS transporter n=1 Tax=Jeongeupia chitinilytica TaxID=1041641 RepID=A0ABQ3GXZ2_9NEIS|nr:MFS transporter [Jeongeupia chitinilytica]GHD60546.1 MFS transporter [Jeongeupia chitinilytica]